MYAVMGGVETGGIQPERCEIKTPAARADGTVNFIFSDPDKNGWELIANG